MPKIDGIEFLQKAGETNPDIPIIMISAMAILKQPWRL
jgi:CheY-like chemotaxis protein